METFLIASPAHPLRLPVTLEGIFDSPHKNKWEILMPPASPPPPLKKNRKRQRKIAVACPYINSEPSLNLPQIIIVICVAITTEDDNMRYQAIAKHL